MNDLSFNPILNTFSDYAESYQQLDASKKCLIAAATTVGIVSSVLFLSAGKSRFRAPTLPIHETIIHQGVVGVYALSTKCQRIFDATIENICKNMNIPIPDNSHEKINLSKKYIHVLALTETDEEVGEAVKFLKESHHQEYGHALIRDFIGRIKKIEDHEKIYEEIIRRTRGPGQLRFHATNELELNSIQEHGLSIKHRSYDRETFLRVLAIDAKAELYLFQYAQQDIKKLSVCTSTEFGHCLSTYGRYNTPEWLSHFLSFANPEEALTKLRERLEAKREVITQPEIDLFVRFISTNLETFKNSHLRKRVFIVCKKDPIQQASSSQNMHFSNPLYLDIMMSKTGNNNERWTQELLSKHDCSFLKPENLDFFIRSPSDE